MKNIKGIGTDLIEIERLRGVIKRKGKAFLEKIFLKRERDYSLKYKDPSIHLAARFAAKEAIAKALGCGFGKDLSFLDIEITNDKKGKPIALLSKKAQKKFDNPEIWISISHTSSYALSFAVING